MRAELGDSAGETGRGFGGVGRLCLSRFFTLGKLVKFCRARTDGKEHSEAAGSFLKRQPRVGFLLSGCYAMNNDNTKAPLYRTMTRSCEKTMFSNWTKAATPTRMRTIRTLVLLSSHSAMWFYKVASRCCCVRRCHRVGIFQIGLMCAVAFCLFILTSFFSSFIKLFYLCLIVIYMLHKPFAFKLILSCRKNP